MEAMRNVKVVSQKNTESTTLQRSRSRKLFREKGPSLPRAICMSPRHHRARW